MDEELEVIHEEHEGEWVDKGEFTYLVFTNSEKEKVMIKLGSSELVMTRFSTPKTIMRFLAEKEAVVVIPTPVGMQHFVTETSRYSLEENRVFLTYRLKSLGTGQVFADYEMTISWI